MHRMEKIASVSEKLLKKLPSGALLVSGSADKPNVMTVAWGTIGMMWGKPVITVPIRGSRFSFKLMDENKEFTVCFPSQEQLTEELKICGTKTGRDIDKFKETGLTLTSSNKVRIGNIEQCNIIVECKKLAKVDMPTETLTSDDLANQWYGSGNPHSIFYGEILDVYER